MGAEETIRAALAKNAEQTATELAKNTGLSRQTIYTLQQQMGFTLADGRRRAARAGVDARLQVERLTSHFSVGASQMTVAADLLLRGHGVYQACAPVGATPLVADVRGKLYRVEVQMREQTRYKALTKKSPRHDILAVVDRDGAVTYRPELPAK